MLRYDSKQATSAPAIPSKGLCSLFACAKDVRMAYGREQHKTHSLLAFANAKAAAVSRCVCFVAFIDIYFYLRIYKGAAPAPSGSPTPTERRALCVANWRWRLRLRLRDRLW
jgi:hypothetical protein